MSSASGGWRRMDAKAEAQEAARQHTGRELHVYPDEDGTVTIRGRLAPEVGALLLKALEAARESLYQRRHEQEAEAEQATAGQPTMEQQQADALALLAETALHAASIPVFPASATRSSSMSTPPSWPTRPSLGNP